MSTKTENSKTIYSRRICTDGKIYLKICILKDYKDLMNILGCNLHFCGKITDFENCMAGISREAEAAYSDGTSGQTLVLMGGHHDPWFQVAN